jgi:hypothetical protein
VCCFSVGSGEGFIRYGQRNRTEFVGGSRGDGTIDTVNTQEVAEDGHKGRSASARDRTG